MATIKARVEALEQYRGPTGGERVYCVVGGADDASAADWIQDQGYTVDDTDMIIRIVGLGSSDEGNMPDSGRLGWCGNAPPEKWRAAA